MEKKFIASYDFGTSAVKAVLVDLQGRVQSSATAGYELFAPHPDWAEQDPGAYWTAVCQATHQAMANGNVKPDEVTAVVFGTQWKGIIPIDAKGLPLYNAIIWLDGRAGEQADALNRKMNTTQFCNKDYWPKLMWVKEKRPEIYEKTTVFLEINSFLKYKATGVMAVDLTNHFTKAADDRLQAEYDRIMVAGEIDPEKFPPLVMSSDKVGGLTEKAASELGLEKETPVFGGCGDIPAIAIGAGCSGMDRAHIYLGSSGWLGVVVPERRSDIGNLYQSLDNGKELMIYALQSACMTYNWAIDQLYHAEKELYKDQVFEWIDREIADVPPGSLNMIATPWLYGERPPLSDRAKAVFFNMSNLHDRHHMIKAVREGICYHLRWCIDTFYDETGKKLDLIRIVGGGATSDRWMQTLADVLQIPVEVPSNARHAGAIGTAYCALIGMGLCESFEAADQMSAAERTFIPQRKHKDTYDRLYRVYRKLYPAMEGLFAEVGGD